MPPGLQPGIFAVLACGRARCAHTLGGNGSAFDPDAGAWFVLTADDFTPPWEDRVSTVRVDVPGDTLNVRRAPGVGAAVLAKLPEGTEVLIDDGPVMVGRSPWYHIQADTSDGRARGWVNGVYLVP
jgi:hypothetical protein